jgi:hypothetical protein
MTLLRIEIQDDVWPVIAAAFLAEAGMPAGADPRDLAEQAARDLFSQHVARLLQRQAPKRPRLRHSLAD